MRPTMKPQKAPMERITVDLFELRGQKYLAMMDYYSSFIMVKCFHKRSSTEKVCKQLDKWMATFSAYRYLRSDGGPEFRETFHKWCLQRWIIHEKGSAYNSPSQGMVEKTLGDTKKTLKKTRKDGGCPYIALSEYRRAPRADRPSPAQMFLRRWCRSSYLPEVKKVLSPEQITGAEEQRDNQAIKVAVQSTTHMERPPFAVGDQVWMQDNSSKLWKIEATVKAIRPSGRSYIVDTGDDLYNRNKRYLKKVSEEVIKVIMSKENSGIRSILRDDSAGERAGKTLSWADQHQYKQKLVTVRRNYGLY